MYLPAAFEETDERVLHEFIRAHPLATFVSIDRDELCANHFPMLLETGDDGKRVLRGHVARANPHWRALESHGVAVAIFHGPDAYVSPAWYEEKRRNGKVVPTWNYSMVVVHGTIKVHHEHDWLLENVGELVARHESQRGKPWALSDAPADYIDVQARAIVGLEMTIERIDAKRKLSQNRSTADFEGGVLRVALPKREETKARKIEITGTSSGGGAKTIEAESKSDTAKA